MVNDNKTAAYLIGHIRVKDPVKWAEYCSKVPTTLIQWQAELVLRGTRAFILEGAYPHGDTVVIRFPDAETIRQWHASAAYQALVPLREQAADVTLVGFEGGR